MTQAELIFDVTAGKHGGVPESKVANLKARPHKTKSRDLVLHVLRIKGGATCKEVAEFLSVPMHKCSGRMTELIAGGRAKKSDVVRDGGRVVLPI